MIKVFMLSALVYISGEGWTKGENVHSILKPQKFATLSGCKAKKTEATKEFKENREYIKEKYGVTRIRLICKKVTISA